MRNKKFITIDNHYNLHRGIMMGENGKKYVMIPVLEETKERLDENTPKSYTYDEMINALVSIWINEKKSNGKSTKSH